MEANSTRSVFCRASNPAYILPPLIRTDERLVASRGVSRASPAAPSPAGSSPSGRRPDSRAMCRTTRKPRAAVVAKYGEKSVYFDLDDIASTTAQWDLYGSDAPSPYNPLQSKFFETFAAPFTKRGLLLKFVLLGGGSLLAYVSASASPDLLPIKEGPQLGPRGKIKVNFPSFA